MITSTHKRLNFYNTRQQTLKKYCKNAQQRHCCLNAIDYFTSNFIYNWRFIKEKYLQYLSQTGYRNSNNRSLRSKTKNHCQQQHSQMLKQILCWHYEQTLITQILWKAGGGYCIKTRNSLIVLCLSTQKWSRDSGRTIFIANRANVIVWTASKQLETKTNL